MSRAHQITITPSDPTREYRVRYVVYIDGAHVIQQYHWHFHGTTSFVIPHEKEFEGKTLEVRVEACTSPSYMPTSQCADATVRIRVLKLPSGGKGIMGPVDGAITAVDHRRNTFVVDGRTYRYSDRDRFHHVASPVFLSEYFTADQAERLFLQAGRTIEGYYLLNGGTDWFFTCGMAGEAGLWLPALGEGLGDDPVVLAPPCLS